MERSLATDVFKEEELTGDVDTLKGGLGAIFGASFRRRGNDLKTERGILGLPSGLSKVCHVVGLVVRTAIDEAPGLVVRADKVASRSFSRYATILCI